MVDFVVWCGGCCEVDFVVWCDGCSVVDLLCGGCFLEDVWCVLCGACCLECVVV